MSSSDRARKSSRLRRLDGFLGVESTWGMNSNIHLSGGRKSISPYHTTGCLCSHICNVDVSSSLGLCTRVNKNKDISDNFLGTSAAVTFIVQHFLTFTVKEMISNKETTNESWTRQVFLRTLSHNGFLNTRNYDITIIMKIDWSHLQSRWHYCANWQDWMVVVSKGLYASRLSCADEDKLTHNGSDRPTMKCVIGNVKWVGE